jgi:hypothetical protein
VARIFLLFDPVDFLKKSNLLGYGELFTAAAIGAQTEAAAVIRTPLALMAI